MPRRILDLDKEKTAEQRAAAKAKKDQERTARNKHNLLVALEANLGNVTLACRAVRLDRKTHYNYMRDDPDYKATVEALSEVALDFVEGCLFEQIQNGSAACTIFYMKTKGRKRGYIEHRALSPEESNPNNGGSVGGIDESMIEEEVPEDSIDDIMGALQEEKQARAERLRMLQEKQEKPKPRIRKKNQR